MKRNVDWDSRNGFCLSQLLWQSEKDDVLIITRPLSRKGKIKLGFCPYYS